MKRFLTCMTALLTFLSLGAAARADILWEPDNTFYEKHREECTYNGRSYYANGAEGFVTLYDAPGGSAVTAQYENGTALCVYWQYQDWGCITVWDETQLNGWVPMSDLYLIYDYISFEEAWGSHFRAYDGEFADYEAKEGDEFWLWEHPNAYGPKSTLKVDQNIMDALQGRGDWANSAISHVYTDRNDETWGFVGYLYGMRNFWILLDNPTCDGIMTSCIPEVDDLIDSGKLTAPQTPVMPAPAKAAAVLPYALVAAVVAATAGLLYFFYHRRRKTTQ